eukprot:TRINITY_DN621_c0_g1_i1.p2 TRINITY_DN621_c0_g1~~TRINITY_DN621_c0_g1_i1.p2  ORF type:complete len:101 (+),score=25.33 TRINITY_DN621_c0_g1_i1:40-303(+)
MYRGDSPPLNRNIARVLLLAATLFVWFTLPEFSYSYGVLGYPLYAIAGMWSTYPVTSFMCVMLGISTYYVRLGPGSKQDKTQLMLSF